VIVGTRQPSVGDLVLAQSISGRWVAELNGSASSALACYPCDVPRRNLTLSWTNVLSGGGSTPLVFDGSGRWRSACTNQIAFTLACQSGVLVFTASYFPDGDCPDGEAGTCSSGGSGPPGLTVVQAVCDPLVLSYAPTSSACPYLVSRGYTKFVVTQ
jgi:hypothetical protein